MKGRLQLPVPAQSCRIIAMRPRLERPVLISTSRHITQGIVDVLEEKWDEITKSLSGRSKVVGSDAYELRIVTSAKGNGWKADTIELSPADTAAGAKAFLKMEDGLLRATIESTASYEVSWSVKFQSSAR